MGAFARSNEAENQTVVTVPQGEQVEHKVNLSRRFDLTLEGEYSIQAQRQVLKSTGNDSGAIVSNVEILIIH